MSQWEKSILEGEYEGKPVWIVDYDGQIEFTFYKSNLHLAEVYDIHTGEEADYDTKEELQWIENDPRGYYYKLYLGARNELLQYLRNPVAWKNKQNTVRAINRRARIPQVKQYRAEEQARRQKIAKANLERMAKGNFKVELGTHFNPKTIYTDSLVEARRKGVANKGAFIYDNKKDQFLGRIDLMGGELYWTTTRPLIYTPVNKDGTVKNMVAYTHRIELSKSRKLYFAKSLDEARALAIRELSSVNNTTSAVAVYSNKNGSQIGLVSKYRKPNGGYTYGWNAYGEGGRGKALEMNGTLRR